MEKLSMCRICLSNDTPLRSIVKTQLQDIYESLTMMPFIADDIRPVRVCNLCCASLENSLELKEKCLQSEKLLAEWLQSDVQVNLLTPDVHLSTAEVSQVTPNVFVKDEVKQENVEDDAAVEPASTSEWNEPLDIVKEEPADIDTDGAAVEPPDAELYHNAPGLPTEDAIPLGTVKEEPLCIVKEEPLCILKEEPLSIVKKEPDDVDAGTPQLTTQMYHEDAVLNSPKRTDQTIDKVGEPETETTRFMEVRPVEVNKMAGPHDNINIMTYFPTLHHFMQNPSTYDHSDAYKQMFENKFSTDSYGDSTSNDKLTPLMCDYCQKSFRFKSDYLSHIRRHTGEKPYECYVCKKCFNQKSNLERHVVIHTGEKRYECNVCNKCFNRKSHLDSHTLTHTGEKPYQCNLCEKCFIQKGQLNSHVLTHTGEKPYQCNVCTKCFIKKGHLTAHMRIHTGDKPHVCNVCNKCFIEKTKLDIHTRTHTGEKPYECNVCKKRFIEKGKLDIHIRTHTGEKPYECDVCKKSFSRKGHLDSHILTHTGEKPYACGFCLKSFSKRSNLNKHTLIHTGDNQKSVLDIPTQTDAGEKTESELLNVRSVSI